MADLLDAEWFADLERTLASLEPIGSGLPRLSLGQVVEDAPAGRVAWTIHVGGGSPSTLEHGVDHAEVTIIEDFETAAALIRGTPTSELLYEGRIKIDGDVAALVAASEVLAQLNAALSR